MVTLDIVILELTLLSIIVDVLFVSVSLVAITQTPFRLAEEQRGVPAQRQVVGRVADPNLGGEQVAVLRLHAAVSWLRNDYSMLLCKGDVYAPAHKVSALTNSVELHKTEV